MSKKLRLGVLFGGRSGEHEVSLMSVHSVFNVLSTEKYDITPIGITRDGIWVTGENVWQALDQNKTSDLTRVTLLPEPGNNWLYAIRQTPSANTLEPLTQIDVLFPVLHGTFGEDGTLQGLLEMSSIAYVGAGVLASSVGMDKALFKDVMRANAIPIVDSIVVTRKQLETMMDQTLDQAETLAPYPLFIKPVNLGSSVGISKCTNRSDLLEGLMDAARFDRRVLIERGLNAREIEVSVLGNENPEATDPGEIVPSDEFYSYRAKYIDGKSGLLIPAPIPRQTAEEIRSFAVKAYKAIDCAGMARVDFLLDNDDGKVYLNEVNTIPGFTEISMYPKLWEANGLAYPQLIDRLIDLALERKAENDRTVRTYDTAANRGRRS